MTPFRASSIGNLWALSVLFSHTGYRLYTYKLCLPWVSAVVDAVLRMQGRPKGPEEKSSLKHIVASLSEAIGVQVSTQEPSIYQYRLGSLTAAVVCLCISWHQCADHDKLQQPAS